MNRQPVNAPSAPAALGPYVHAVRAGELLFCSGQTPLDPSSGELVGGTVADQTRQALANVGAVLAAAGLAPANVVKTTVYLTDMAAFAEMNAVYGEFFAANPPARTTVAVAALPKGAQVEIEAVAVVGD